MKCCYPISRKIRPLCAINGSKYSVVARNGKETYYKVLDLSIVVKSFFCCAAIIFKTHIWTQKTEMASTSATIAECLFFSQVSNNRQQHNQKASDNDVTNRITIKKDSDSYEKIKSLLSFIYVIGRRGEA